MSGVAATLRRPALHARAVLGTRLFRFAAVGAFTTALDLALFTVAAEALGAPVAPANVGSYGSCVVVSFLLNRRWTFRGDGTRSAWRAFARFLASNLAGIALSTALVTAFATVAPPVAAKAASVPIVFLWNYAVARFWVFR